MTTYRDMEERDVAPTHDKLETGQGIAIIMLSFLAVNFFTIYLGIV